MRKSYEACSVSMDLPKDLELRKQINLVKVEVAQLNDQMREIDVDSVDEKKLLASGASAKKKAVFLKGNQFTVTTRNLFHVVFL